MNLLDLRVLASNDMGFGSIRIPLKRHDVFNFFVTLELNQTRYWYCYTFSGSSSSDISIDV